MIQTKAFRILSSLNNEEYSEFEKFIKSPYFNRSKDLLKFFSAVKKYYPEFKHIKLGYENLYKKLYQGKLFNEGTIRNLYSDLGSLAERFLGYINYEKTFEFGLNTIIEMNKRYLDKDFEKNYKKLSDKNETEEDVFYKKNLNKYFLYNEMSNHNLRTNIVLNYDTQNLSSEALLAFFIREFLLNYSNWLSTRDTYNSKPEYNVVEIFFETVEIKKLIHKLKEHNNIYSEDMELFYYLNAAAQNKEGKFYEDFEKAYTLFKTRIDSMSLNGQRRMYAWVRNVINLNIKPDDKKLRRIIFEIGKEMVEKRIIFDSNGGINSGIFVNILLTAIVAGEIQWAKDFLEDNINRLDDNSKMDIYFYYKAKILSCEKKFAESNEQLLAINKDNILFKADSKVLRMINYYELSYYEAAYSQVDAFRQFLNRNDSISTGRKEKSLNFLKFYLNLLRKKSGTDVNLSFTKKELQECNVIRNKDWLLNKANELNK